MVLSDRATRAKHAATLRTAGYTRREIGQMLGLSVSGVGNLLSDPTGEKQRVRRERYRGRCEECGAATDGSSGRAAAPTICARCIAVRQHNKRYWTRESVLAAVAAINEVCVETLGRPIRAADWTVRYDSQVLRYSEERLVESDRLWAALTERGLTPLVHLTAVRREVGGLEEAKRLLGIEDSKARSGGSPMHRRRIAA